MNILIAEDHLVVRMGATLLINTIYPSAQIVEVADFESTLAALSQQPFDLLLLDLNIPGGDTIRMIEAAKLRQQGIQILIFSGYDEQLYGLRCLRAGANGYLHKDASATDIRNAIEKVLSGGRYISEQIQQQLLEGTTDGENQQGELSSLSDRELEVMHLMMKGHSATEIKSILHLQSSTISTYKSRIFEKMGVANLIELAGKIKFQNTSPGR